LEGKGPLSLVFTCPFKSTTVRKKSGERVHLQKAPVSLGSQRLEYFYKFSWILWHKATWKDKLALRGAKEESAGRPSRRP
jgi:hypothetical protein